jgi:hypothetical protein
MKSFRSWLLGWAVTGFGAAAIIQALTYTMGDRLVFHFLWPDTFLSIFLAYEPPSGPLAKTLLFFLLFLTNAGIYVLIGMIMWPIWKRFSVGR